MKRLDKDQKEALLQWVAEGLETGEINKRAAAFFPPFHVSRQQVDHYRKTRSADLEEITQAAEYDALHTGYAVRANLIRFVNEALTGIAQDMGESRWVTDAKGVNGEVVYVERFNEPLFRQGKEYAELMMKLTGDKSEATIATGEITVIFRKPEARP